MIELLISLLDKILWAGFAFSVLGVFRVIYMFVWHLRQTPPQQLKLNHKEVISLGVFIAVIIMSIFTGIRI